MPRGKLVRQVNTKMTQRARNSVGVAPKRVRENTRETTPRSPSRRSGKTANKSVGGRGLSGAGPRRSGGQLTRAAIKRKTANKSAVRQPKSEASQATGGRQRLPGLSRMILRAVTHRGGVTLAKLQQVLADGGYDVSKNNNRVSASLKTMVAKGTLLQRAGSYRLNSTQLKMSRAGEKKMKTTAVVTAKGTGSPRRAGKAIKASKLKSKSSPARKPAKQARKSPAKGKKQAGKQMGRNATLATKAKKQTARKAKTT